VDGLDVRQLLGMLDALTLEHERLHVLEHAVRARLAELVTAYTARPRPPAAFLTPKEAAARLRVSRDYLRDHGHDLGIAVEIGPGVTRYDADAVAALGCQRQRAHQKLPRD
jgi:hypothetical protein